MAVSETTEGRRRTKGVSRLVGVAPLIARYGLVVPTFGPRRRQAPDPRNVALVMRSVKCAGGGLITRTAAASAAMTASQHVEIALTRRPESDLPVRIMERLIGHSVAGGAARVAVGQTTQSLLAASAVIMARLMSRVPVAVAIAADSLFLVMTNAVVARALNLGDMPWSWSHRDLATDLTHKTSLATTAVLLTRGQHAVER